MVDPIGQLRISKSILIKFKLRITSRLDAVDARKNVLAPMEKRRYADLKLP